MLVNVQFSKSTQSVSASISKIIMLFIEWESGVSKAYSSKGMAPPKSLQQLCHQNMCSPAMSSLFPVKK